MAPLWGGGGGGGGCGETRARLSASPGRLTAPRGGRVLVRGYPVTVRTPPPANLFFDAHYPSVTAAVGSG